MKTPSIHPVKVAALTALCSVSFVSANGFYIPVQAPEATSRGNAFVATANTAAAVYYNAAGLTQLNDTTLQVGVYGVTLGLDAKVTGGSFSSTDDWQLIPQIYAAMPVNDKLVLGLGLNTPFGLSTEWGNEAPFRNSVGAVKAEILYATFWTVAAYKLTDTVSVGVGLGISQVDGELRTGAAGLGLFDPDNVLIFEGDDIAVSWTASVRWQPCEQHAFGLVYRSQTDFDVEGTSKVTGVLPSGKSSLDLITPATFAVGYSYRPNKCWNIEANIEWVGWNELNTLTMKNANGLPDLPIVFDWEDNFIYGIGATHELGNGYRVSFGYNYIENSQPDSTFTPAVADADRHWLTCGFGHEGESWSWDTAYQYAFSDRTVNGAPDPSADGKYKSRFHSLSLSARYKF